MIQEPLAIIGVLLGVIFLSVKVTEAARWAERLSVVLWILFLAAVASNSGLIPSDAPVYGQVIGFAVPFAVSLVLMKVNLADVRRAGKALTVAFLLACLGTVVAVIAASLALEVWLAPILGDASWKIAGPYTGTYIGGSLNFFALWAGLEIGEPDLFAAANAVDNLSIFPLFAFWIFVPRLLGHRFPVAERWRVAETETKLAAADSSPPRLIPRHIATLSFAAVAVMLTSDWAKRELLDPVLPDVPTILLVTTLSLGLGQLRPIRRLEGAWEVGNLAFYLFFAAVGAMIHLLNAVRLAPMLFAYVLVIIVLHMLVVYGLGRLLRLDVAVLTIASTAAKSGPPLVIPMAELQGRKELALPGVVMGLLGYALGNYVGVAVAHLVRVLL